MLPAFKYESIEPNVDPLRSLQRGVKEGLRLLIVEDDSLVSKCLHRGLRPYLEVEVADSASSAIERLKEDPCFDTILSDFNMPDHTGVELRRLVQETCPEFEGNFCFMTGGGFEGEVAELLEREPERCIEKPFTIGELRVFLRSQGLYC